MKKFLAGVVTGSLSTIAVMAMCDIISDMIYFSHLEKDDDIEDDDDADDDEFDYEGDDDDETAKCIYFTVENENMENLPE